MIVSRKEYEPPPLGNQPAVCWRYFDLGLQRGYNGKIQRKLAVFWELESRRSDGARHLVSKIYTASLAVDANLTADLVSWRGQEFSPDELRGFELDQILGKACTLKIVEAPGEDGKPYVEVETVLRPLKGWQPFPLETPDDYVPDWVIGFQDKQIRGGVR